MDVSAVGQTGQGHEVQAKAAVAAEKQPPPPPPAKSDSLQISGEAKALASSVLDE